MVRVQTNNQTGRYLKLQFDFVKPALSVKNLQLIQRILGLKKGFALNFFTANAIMGFFKRSKKRVDSY